nr:VanZ family protein [uncultured Blautia sp.]
MDLYQIFITHNRPWSIREILLFFVIFTAAAGFFYRRYKQGRIVMSQVVSGLLLLCFLAIVYGSTVFTRIPSLERTYEMKLFWSWKEVFRGNGEMLKEILLNMILLFPAGLLLPCAAGKKLSWKKGLAFGLFVSTVIEISQLVLCRGLFEWDDILHNSLGCMAGCVVSKIIFLKRTVCADISDKGR